MEYEEITLIAKFYNENGQQKINRTIDGSNKSSSEDAFIYSLFIDR